MTNLLSSQMKILFILFVILINKSLQSEAGMLVLNGQFKQRETLNKED